MTGERATIYPPAAWSLGSILRTHRGVVATVALYAGSALIVPTMADAAVSDDWMYAWHVEGLLRLHEVRLHELSTSNAVFQTVWGALFGAVFGMSFGALRLSTVVLVAVSAVAVYLLCSEVGGERRACTLATAAYLFNPLSFALSYTFMTDSHFTALLVMSVLFYARGLNTDPPGARAIVAGSGFAALAFLVRPQAVLIPAAVAAYLLARGRVGLNARSALLLTRIAGLPALTILVFQLWLTSVHGVPRLQRLVWTMLLQIDLQRLWELVSRVAWAEGMYLGFFVLPLVAAAFPRVRLLVRQTRFPMRAVVGAWAAFLVVGIGLLYGGEARLMPYVPQFFNEGGIGPHDLLGGRPVVLSHVIMAWLTLITAVCSVVFVLMVSATAGSGAAGAAVRLTRGADDAPANRRREADIAGVCAAVRVFQALGAMFTSVHVRASWISYDRYLLPLLPLALCLGVWGLRGSRPSFAVGWVTVAALATFSVAGTRDFLVLQRETWTLARWANASGIPNESLDAGAAWDGWSFADDPAARNGPLRSPTRPPWWVDLWGRTTDSSYVIAAAHLPGYDVVRQVEYPTLLSAEPTHLYLLRRQDVGGPIVNGASVEHR